MNGRGRPKKEKKLVPLIVLVRPEVKDYFSLCARYRMTTMSEEVRQVLDHWYETR